MGAVLLVAIPTASPRAALLINEVLYDPAGSDSGKEFVEIICTSQAPLSVDGVILEAGNGAAPDEWSVQWAAPPGTTLGPGAIVWIGGRPDGVEGDPDFPVTLRLQNGPDAVRLRRGEEILDTVGWGELHWQGYYEGHPAPDVPQGQSLGRVPDGWDSDDNAGDFRSMTVLTPGGPNHEPPVMTLEKISARPAVASPGMPVVWSALLVNAGVEPLDLAGASAYWDGTFLEVPFPSSIPPGAGAQITWDDTAPDAEGVWEWELRIASAGEEASTVGRLRVGTGALVVAEIQYDPAPGEGEWVELAARSGVSSLSGWSLEDATGTRIVIEDERPASPGDRFLLAQDPESLLQTVPGLADVCLTATSGSWPSLNNTVQEELGAADILILRDPMGLASDEAPYAPVGGSGDGITLERRDLADPPDPSGGWLPAPAGATPGEPGLAESLDEVQGTLMVEPPVIEAGRGCLIVPPGLHGSRTWRAEVFDISGRRVRILGLQKSDAREPLFWWGGEDDEGRPVTPGFYVVNVHAWESGSPGRSWSAALTVAP